MIEPSQYQNSLITQYEKSKQSMNIRVALQIEHKKGARYIATILQQFIERNDYFLYYINGKYKITKAQKLVLQLRRGRKQVSRGIEFGLTELESGVQVTMNANHILYDGKSILNIINAFTTSLNTGEIVVLEDGSSIFSKRAITYKNVNVEALKGFSPLRKKRGQRRARTQQRIEKTIAQQLFAKLQAYCATQKLTLPMLFIGSIGWVFKHDFNGEDIAIGNVVDVRMHPRENAQLGLAINTVPVIIPVHEKVKVAYFWQLKKQYFQALKGAYVAQTFTGFKPDILFSYQQSDFVSLTDGVCSLAWEPLQNSAIPLAITLSNEGGHVSLYVDYDSNVYDEATINNKIARLFVLLEQLTDQRLALMPPRVLSERDVQMQQALVGKCVETPCTHSCYDVIIEKWQDAVVDKPFVIYKDEYYSFTTIYEKTQKLAQFLRQEAVGPGDVVGIEVASPLTHLIAILATWELGAVFVPLDWQLPQVRKDYIKDMCNVAFVVDEAMYADFEMRPIEPQVCTCQHVRTKVQEAYIIFTSGTTGVPRGCRQTHDNLLNHLLDDTMRLSEKSVFLQAVQTSFDVALMGIVALMHGASVVLQDQGEIGDAAQTMVQIAKYKVSALNTTSAMFEQWVPTYLDVLKGVSSIMVGGEALNEALVARVYDVLKNKLINGYGPTETTIFSVAKRITKRPQLSVPIGKPIVNTRIKIVDADCNYVGIGEVGELCIIGRGVGNGYVGEDEATAEKFKLIDNERAYFTGDRCYVDFTGDIIFVGRTDDQLKLDGFRIDPLEITRYIESFRTVKQALVVKINNRLVCAYVLTPNGTAMTNDDFKRTLANRLPTYMIPHTYIAVERFELTPNGKVDVKRMRQQLEELMGMQAEVTYVSASLSVNEQTIIACWEDILGYKPSTKEETLAEAGATSLDVIRLHAALNAAFVEQADFDTFTNKLSVTLLAQRYKTLAHASEQLKGSVSGTLQPTVMQQEIFLAYMKDENSTTYNVPVCIKLGMIDEDKFITAVNTVCGELTELNMNFYERKQAIVFEGKDRPFQPLKHVVLSDSADILRYIKPFKLERDELIRFFLFETPRGKYFFIDSHHIIMDGITIEHILQRINELYKGTKKTPPHIPNFMAYVAFENKHRGDSVFWSNELTKSEKYTLVSGVKRGQIKGKSNSHIHIHVVSGLTSRLKMQGLDLNTYIVMCLGLLAVAHQPRKKSFVGMMLSARVQQDFVRTNGLLLNTIPFVYDYDILANVSFVDVFTHINKQIQTYVQHQFFDFQHYMREVMLAPNSERFDVVINIREAFSPVGFGTIVEPEAVDVGAMMQAKFPLTIELIKQQDDVAVQFTAIDGVFDDAEVTLLFHEFVHILQTLQHHQGSEHIYQTTLALLQQQRKAEAAGLQCPLPSVYEAFAEQVALAPMKCAIETTGADITYQALALMVELQARELQEKYDLNIGDRVGLLFTKRPEMIIAMLACAKLGLTYVPINVDFPPALQQGLCELAQTRFVLGNTSSELITDYVSAHTLAADESVCEMVTMSNSLSDTPLYILFTSGTTGTPKGIEVSHANVTNLVKNNFQDITEKKTILFSDYSFDGSVYDIYVALLNGGTLVLVDAAEIKNPDTLCELIVAKKVTTFFMPSAYFHSLTRTHYQRLSSVERLFIGGEAARLVPIQKAFDYLAGKLFNAYGPTEATVFTTIKEITAADIATQMVPIGQPLKGINLAIADAFGYILPPYTIGEIIISGAGVSNGYINGDNGVFTNDGTCYASGDLGYYNVHGDVIYVGRKGAQQVKLNGYRIELGAIEHALLASGFVNNAVVVFAEKSERLCMFLVPQAEHFDIRELIAHLRTKMPEYMIPTFYQIRGDLPLNKNGKVDRGGLPIAEVKSIYEGEEAQGFTPQTTLDAKVLEIWLSVLELKHINASANFFELGGYSLQAMQVVSRLRRLGLDISIQDIVAHPVFADFCLYVQQVFGQTIIAAHADNFYSLATDVAIKTVNRTGAKIQVAVLPTYMLNFAYAMIFEQLSQAYNAHVEWDICNFATSENIVEAYAAQINATTKRTKKLLLLGYSFGGALAYEVAYVLKEKYGRFVDGIIMIDTYFKVKPDTGLEFFMSDLNDREKLRAKLIEFFPPYEELAPAIQDDVETTVQGFLARTVNVTNKKYDLPTRLYFLAAEFEAHGMQDTRDEWFEGCFKATKKYAGYGKHNYMFNEENVDKNFEIIETIIACELEGKV
jgi:amino acid adenylation domain-containing protein